MADEAITIKTILFNGQVAGQIASFQQFGETEVTYWLGREYWGQGIATGALGAFLDLVETGPLYARAAKDNAASLRVLQKCGFTVVEEDKGSANARGQKVEECVLKLG